MHKLVRQADKRAAQQRVKELQVDWREVGKIPVFKYKRLQTDFRSLANRIFGSPDDTQQRRPSDARGPRQFAPRQNTAPARDGWVNPNEAISTKKDLIRQAQQLAEDAEGDGIHEVRRLREAWKDSGRISREKSMELTTQFNEACDTASEQSFLNRAARAKDPDYDNNSRAEQVSLKIELLETSLVRDENELVTRRDNVGNQSNPLEARQAEGKLRQQIRKVNTKRKLIQSLKNELADY